jgi:hypothetical protein
VESNYFLETSEGWILTY